MIRKVQLANLRALARDIGYTVTVDCMELRVCMPEGRGDDVLPNNEAGYQAALAQLRQLKEYANAKQD